MWSNAEIARATRENLPNKEFNQPLTKKSRTDSLVSDSDNVHTERRVTRVVRILGRRYPLTDTFYKYLDIGVRIGGSCDVELAIGDVETKLNFLWIRGKISYERGITFCRFVLILKLRQLNDVKLANLSNSTVSMFMSEKTVQKLFAFEYCIDHMYSWLSENLYLVESKYKKFIEIRIMQRQLLNMKILSVIH
ncbi:uncharacterized protein LOC128879937 [Hylaeus volcanicus]|uniref:uncharacterized protein LOC128879937 n=1 Tax=Hylaeus volcanicus TaxID=313075 RepID=UPI0023B7E130|nr:uncharacterized protein LOC128879937 [Hylaeus volcanicus]